VKLWDVETGELARVFPGRTTADFSPDGKTIACPSATPSADGNVGKVDLYDLKEGSLVRSYFSERGPSKSSLLCVTFSPDGQLVAATDWNGTVTIWNVETGQRVRTIAEHEAGVLSAAFAPDGSMLATGSEDKTLRLWNLLTE
jgi:WD40 repeat protein